jgi:translation elongation factor IF5A
MVLKLINATEAKPGTTIMIEGSACSVKSQDISKTGKHGASKVRLEAIGIVDNKKRVVVVPGHERFEVPMIKKMKGQVLSLGEKISLMDLESFETYDVAVSEDIRPEIKEGDSVEYWDIEGIKIIKRKL